MFTLALFCSWRFWKKAKAVETEEVPKGAAEGTEVGSFIWK